MLSILTLILETPTFICLSLLKILVLVAHKFASASFLLAEDDQVYSFLLLLLCLLLVYISAFLLVELILRAIQQLWKEMVIVCKVYESNHHVLVIFLTRIKNKIITVSKLQPFNRFLCNKIIIILKTNPCKNSRSDITKRL